MPLFTLAFRSFSGGRPSSRRAGGLLATQPSSLHSKPISAPALPPTLPCYSPSDRLKETRPVHNRSHMLGTAHASRTKPEAFANKMSKTTPKYALVRWRTRVPRSGARASETIRTECMSRPLLSIKHASHAQCTQQPVAVDRNFGVRCFSGWAMLLLLLWPLQFLTIPCKCVLSVLVVCTCVCTFMYLIDAQCHHKIPCVRNANNSQPRRAGNFR